LLLRAAKKVRNCAPKMLLELGRWFSSAYITSFDNLGNMWCRRYMMMMIAKFCFAWPTFLRCMKTSYNTLQ
jgi:hypothetical protein